MKTPLNILRTGAIMAAIVLSTLSCHKDSTTNTGNQNSDDQAAIGLEASATSTESLFDDAFDVVMLNSPQGTVNPSSNPGKSVNSLQTNEVNPDCTTITVSPADAGTYPKTITVDYGTAGCVNNNVTRKGKLIVSLSGPARTVGSTIGVVFQNYSVNGYAINGSYNLTPVAGTSGGINYNIAIIGGTITPPSGAAYTYNCNETFTQTAGMGTTAIADDDYSITGSFTYAGGGVTINGNITTPLVRPAGCTYITQGVIAFTFKGIAGAIDFGTGGCDATATVTAGTLIQTVVFIGRLNRQSA